MNSFFITRMRTCLLILSLSTLPNFVHAQFVSFDPIVSTFAGTGAVGLVNGAGNVAKFNVVSDIGIDSKGNAFVVDGKNNCIRKITPAGVVSTFGNTTTLNNPHHIAIDKNDNLYITDLNNRCIRKLTPAGIYSTVGGVVGSAAFIDGPKGTGKLYVATHIAVDEEGNLYVTDKKFINNMMLDYIRKVTPTGTISTLVGGPYDYVNGAGSKARFRGPSGIVTDKSGNLYVVDGGNNAIRKIHLADTMVSTFAGGIPVFGHLDGPLLSAQFHNSVGIAFDKVSRFYVTDYQCERIRKIADGYVTTLAGVHDTAGYVNGAGTLAKFDYPLGIAADSTGNVLVCDVSNNVIRKISPQKTTLFTANPATPSAIQTLYVSGDHLDGSLLTVRVPEGYEVSLSEQSGFGSEVQITGKDGSVTTTKVYLRLKANTSLGVKNGEALLSGTVSQAIKTASLPLSGNVTTALGLENERNAIARIYPNPATTELLIETTADWKATECQIVSLEGKLLYSAALSLSSTSQTLDISGLKEGIYVLKLSDGKQTAFKTFAKKN